jgi:hypothetical protein
MASSRIFRVAARVTHLVRGPELEVPAGFVVLSIEVLGARGGLGVATGVSRGHALRPATSQAAS